MIIIFEGPDGSGKSTLITCLEDALIGSGYKVMANAHDLIPDHPKASHRPEGAERIDEKTMFARLTKMAKDKQMIYLVDRGPISDIIYRVFDDYTTVTTLNKLIDWLNKTKNVKIMYCRNKKSEEYMRKRGDDNPVALNRYKELCKVYDLVFDRIKAESKFKVIDYDFTKRNALNETIGYVNSLVDLVM